MGKVRLNTSKGRAYGSLGLSGGTGGTFLERIARKKPLIILSVFFTALLFYSESFYTSVGFGFGSQTNFPLSIRNTLMWEVDDKYLVKMPGCKIIEMDHFDSSVRKFLNRKAKVLKCNKALVKLVNQSLIIDEETMKSWKFKGTTCCYKKITRPQQDPIMYNANADNNIKVEDECIKIPHGPKGVVVADPYVKVECINDHKVGIFEDFYPVILPAQTFSNDTKRKSDFWTQVEENYKKLEKKTEQLIRPPNFLVIGVDSISRQHMRRSLPYTKDFLINNDFVEMKGYTKVGENTFPNILAGFAGLTDETRKSCWPKTSSKLDDCPLIWKNFSNLNYMTALVEDAPHLAIFNYAKTGFVVPPVDYYLRPFMIAAKKRKYSSSASCLGGELPPTDVMMKYVSEIIANVGNKYPYFILSWFTSISHDDFNGLQNEDLKYRDFLQETVKKAGENTVILFISDHGYRFGSFRETFLGFYEDNLPFFFLRLPPSLKSRFPHWYKNLHTNSQRLTSPFDLYSTAIDIHNYAASMELNYNNSNYHANTENSTDGAKVQNLQKPNLYLKKLGPSFFEIGPPNRTCESSKIHQRFCMCGVSPQVASSSEMATKVSQLIVEQINDQLTVLISNKTCANLSFTKVLYSREVGEGEVWNQLGKLIPYKDYLLALDTKPGQGKFEARVRSFSNDTLEILGDISRINSYAGKSDCINDFILKNFCMCQNVVEREAAKAKKEKEKAAKEKAAKEKKAKMEKENKSKTTTTSKAKAKS